MGFNPFINDSGGGGVGPRGPQGPAGESAYEIWLDEGNTGTEQDFLDSLKGETGPQGPQGVKGETGSQGPQGEEGAVGADGVSVTDVEVNSSNHLIVTLSDSTEVDAGEVQGRLTTLTYGVSTWNDFITAYENNTLVYCKAYSSGSQARLAFMAYVNNDNAPTEVEFQYYRSVSSKNLSNQCDQVIIYTLKSDGTWTTATRNTDVKFAAGAGLAADYANNTLTFKHNNSVTAKTIQGFAQIAYDAQGHITGSTAATTAQVNAIDSGITSTDVIQIGVNENNILSIQDHYKYDNRILFEQEAIPTGTIANGSTWIDGKAVRTYNQTTNIVGGVIEQGSWNASNLKKEDSTNRCRLSNSITVQPSTTYTITLNSPTINNARLLLQYRDSNDYTSSESGWQATLPYTFTTPPACHKATIIFSNTGNTTCTPTDFGNLQINEAGSLLSYEVPSWSTSSVDDVKKNEANILSEQGKTTGMTEGGSNYITVNGIRVYVSATAPTGARTGDLWIGG